MIAWDKNVNFIAVNGRKSKYFHTNAVNSAAS